MGLKKILKKISYFILNSPNKKVNITIEQVKDGSLLKGKNILIVGGSSGIGFAIAKRCQEEGANVIISSSNSEKLNEATKKIKGNCFGITFDISKVKSINTFLDECTSKFGGNIDALICSAGISLHEGNYKNVTEDGFDKQFNINMKGTYFLCKSYLEKISNKNNGNLLVISSETADQCYDIPYGMTKASLNSMICALSRREYQNGIRVNGIAPGVTQTDMTKDYAEVVNGDYSRVNAMGRIALPEEIAEVSIFLLSDRSKCISGEIIHCNAGNHLKAFWDITN